MRFTLILSILILPAIVCAQQWNEHTIDPNCDGPRSVFSVDMDGDDDNDILIAADYDDDVLWCENLDGTGTSWTEHLIDGSFNAPYSVFAEDLDGDGDMDVFAAAYGGDMFSWWENMDGTGTSWQEHQVRTGFDAAYKVCAADLDSDGDIDLIGAGVAVGGNILWWENSDGTCENLIEHEVDLAYWVPHSLWVDDMDGDGDNDLLATAYQSDAVTWWENVDGNAENWVEHTVDDQFDGSCWARSVDMDGDGDPDIVGCASEVDEYRWWENTDGTATQWTSHLIANNQGNPLALEIRDIDNDGDFDIAGSNDTDNSILWIENVDGDGLTWSEHVLTNTFDTSNAVYLADVDGDLDYDIIGAAGNLDAVHWWENPEPFVAPGLSVDETEIEVTWDQDDAPPEVFITIINSGGSLLDWEASETCDWFCFSEDEGLLSNGQSQTIQVIFGDYPEPGTYIETLTTSAILAVPETRDITLTVTVPPALEPWIENVVDTGCDYPRSVFSADMDGDGDIDILAAADLDRDILWWENTDGTGTNWNEHLVDGNYLGAIDVYAADMDGDGDNDILGAAYGHDLFSWWENLNGDGTSWEEHIFRTSFDGAYKILATDLDGDGDNDIVAGGVESGGMILCWINEDGTGQNLTEYTVDGSFLPQDMYFADVDGDGDPDIVATCFQGNSVSWWENENGTTWTAHVVDNSVQDASSVFAGDIDGDNDIDIIASSDADSEVCWWENTNSVGTSWQEHLIANTDIPNPMDLGAADIDQDSNMDVVGAIRGSDKIVWWQNEDGSGINWNEYCIVDNFGGAVAIHVNDIDLNGTPDVVGTACFDDEVSWWINPFDPPALSISGSINYFSDLSPVENVELILSGANTFTTLSNMSGEFIFNDLANDIYELCPTFNEDLNTGVNTLDAYRIQQHVVDLVPFDNALQMLAADIDASLTVNTIDAYFIQRMVIGLDNDFDPQFVFVDSDYAVNFENWHQGPACRYYPSLDQAQSSQNFECIRIGDANGDWNTTTTPLQSLDEPGILAFEDITVNPGDTFEIPLLATDFSAIHSVEIKGSFDPSVITLQNLNFQYATQNYLSLTSDSTFALSWYSLSEAINGQDSEIFSIEFEAVGAQGQTSALIIDHALIGNENGEAFEISIENGNISIDNNSSTADNSELIPDSWALYPAYPNPFNPTTNVTFDVKEQGKVSINLYSVLGRHVREIVSSDFATGRYNVIVNADNLSTGMYFLVMKSNSVNLTQKLMLIK